VQDLLGNITRTLSGLKAMDVIVNKIVSRHSSLLTHCLTDSKIVGLKTGAGNSSSLPSKVNRGGASEGTVVVQAVKN